MVRDEQITVGRHGGRVGSKKTLSMELSLSHPEAIILGHRNGTGTFTGSKNITLHGGTDN